VDKFRNPEMFWIPLLLLYTGARSNEVCMLRTADIQFVADGVSVIKFRNRSEYQQRTKNKKDRQSPIHSQLIKLGFLEYVAGQTKMGHDRLFDNLVLYNGKWNIYFGKDFNRTFKKQFLKGYTTEQLSEKDLHSFRKTFISWFITQREYANMTDISILQSIVGHFEKYEISMLLGFIEASKLTTDVYGGGFGQESQQNELLQCLDYGLDFSPLEMIKKV
jgi:integrase